MAKLDLSKLDTTALKEYLSVLVTVNPDVVVKDVIKQIKNEITRRKNAS